MATTHTTWTMHSSADPQCEYNRGRKANWHMLHHILDGRENHEPKEPK